MAKEETKELVELHQQFKELIKQYKMAMYSQMRVVHSSIEGNCLYIYSMTFTQFDLYKINELCNEYGLTFVVSFTGNKLFVCITKNILS